MGKSPALEPDVTEELQIDLAMARPQPLFFGGVT